MKPCFPAVMHNSVVVVVIVVNVAVVVAFSTVAVLIVTVVSAIIVRSAKGMTTSTDNTGGTYAIDVLGIVEVTGIDIMGTIFSVCVVVNRRL